jgi:glycosyltransferase involved in cell wall biosynthesis
VRVLFQSRKDVFTQAGGDSTQLLKTREFLEKTGVRVDVSTDSQATLTSYDIIHVFNITGKYHTTLFQILNAKKNKKIVALSPIYWNESELQKMEDRFIASTLALANIDKTFSKYLAISVLKNLNSQRVLDTTTYLRDWFMKNADEEFKIRITLGEKTAQKMCLDLADIVLPNSMSEANLLVRDFNVPREKMVVVPNGVDINFSNPDQNLFRDKFEIHDDFVLSVANLGSRKNTLALIHAVMNVGVPLVLIGAYNHQDMYCRVCIRDARKAKTMILGKFPHESELLVSAYGAARVHALVSWFETPGLSSLEAALAGCNIVVSDRGSTRDYFKNYAWYCDPADVASISNALSEAYHSPKRCDLKFRLLNEYTWDKVAEKTLDAYRQVSNDHIAV